MHAIARWSELIGPFVIAVSLLGATPAAAQDTSTQEARATQTFNDAVDAGKAGRNDAACRGFGNAAVMYENTIGSLMAQSMATEEDREYIKRYANNLQASADQAKKAAKAACYLRDNPAPAPVSPSPAPAQSYGDVDSQMEALQRVAQRAKGEYQEADRLYDSGDRPGACASARASAASFAQIAAAMRANSALEGAFANADQIYANAAQVAKDRDGYFCRG